MTDSMHHILVQADEAGLYAEPTAARGTNHQRPEATNSLDELVPATLAAVRKLGFRYCLYGGRFRFAQGRVQQVILSGYPAAWMARYVAQNYAAIDPIIDRAYSQPTPVYWDEALFDTPARRTMWEEAAHFGVGAGVTVPVAGGPNEIAILSAAGSLRPGKPPATPAIVGQLYLIAAQMHAAIRPVLTAGQPAESADEALSAREKECLGWWAAGKTAEDIAVLLTVSARTVRFHLENVKRKLGARNRADALSKAVEMGLIRP